MTLKTVKSLLAITAFAAVFGHNAALAEARWDGLYTNGPNFNFFDLKETQTPQDALEARGIETDFSAEERFEPEFQIDTLRDRLRRPFTGSDRNR